MNTDELKMDFLQKIICGVILIMMNNYCIWAASVTLNFYVDSSVVSQGTEAVFECYSSTIPDNFFQLGGRIEFIRYPHFSQSMEVIAEWTPLSSQQILLDNLHEQYKVEGIPDGNNFTQKLTIRRTKKADQGHYYCAIFDSTGLKVVESNQILLKVKYPPADHYPVCTAIPEMVGDNIELYCESEQTTPAATLHWFKGDVKVADGTPIEKHYTSFYEARPGELDSQFECRLAYDDETGTEVNRKCRFSRPFVNVTLQGFDQSNELFTYLAFAYANPPFVTGLNCTVEPSSAGTQLTFVEEFPGYGTFTTKLLPEGVHIACRAGNVFGNTEVIVNTTLTAASTNHPCVPQPAESSQGQGQVTDMLPFIVGVSLLSLALLVLVAILTSVIWKKGKPGSRSPITEAHGTLIPQVSYRSDSTSGGEYLGQAGNSATIQRALPAQPVDLTSTTTLRSVVTTPALGFDTLTRQKLESVSSNATTTTNMDMPYQDMVGDTGIMKSRHGSFANDARPDIHALLCRSKSIPASMVPGPNGGFLPHRLVATDGRRIQRSASESHDSNSDACYEIPDAVQERRQLTRAVSNDYQYATSPMITQKEFLISHMQCANTPIQGDDSVFPALDI